MRFVTVVFCLSLSFLFVFAFVFVLWELRVGGVRLPFARSGRLFGSVYFSVSSMFCGSFCWGFLPWWNNSR